MDKFEGGMSYILPLYHFELKRRDQYCQVSNRYLIFLKQLAGADELISMDLSKIKMSHNMKTPSFNNLGRATLAFILI